MTTRPKLKTTAAVLAVSLASAIACAAPARAQACSSTQDAAVECFVTAAVKTNLTSLRYGMTLPQFRSYGVAISKILQSQQTYLVLAGISSAVSDAMPPTNADGSANLAAQQAANTSIVEAELASGIIALPPETTEQQMIWFTFDLTGAMNQSGGILMAPGFLLRWIDSYIVSATANGTVNWTQVNSIIAQLVTSLQSAAILTLPANVTLAQVISFAQSLAQIIFTYKSATGRASL
jgi:hypothetical protein